MNIQINSNLMNNTNQNKEGGNSSDERNNNANYKQEQKLIQNNNINDLSNEDIIPKISTFLQLNKFVELSKFLSLNKNKISDNILSSFISFILEAYNGDKNILDIFLSNGANVNSIIYSTNCQIEKEEQINLLMFSIITNNIELFNVVIKYKPDILLEDKNKENSLVKSILFNDDNNPLILQELLKLNNEAINCRYYDQENNLTHNLLTFAVFKNKKNIVTLLLENNCDINYQIPETGETAMHIAAKNDNLEIAEILNSNPKYIRNKKNKLGETPKDIVREKKSKIFFQLIQKEQQMNHSNTNSNNNLPKVNQFNNINNLNNNQNIINIPNINNNNFSSNKKNKEKTNKFENNDEYLYYEDNNKDNLIIPIELKSLDYPTYLSIGEDTKLCLDLFENEESLHNHIEDLKNQIYEKTKSIKEDENFIQKKREDLLKIEEDIKNIEENIKKQKRIKISQEKQINEIEAQNKEYSKLLENLKKYTENNRQSEESISNYEEQKENNNNLFDCSKVIITEEEFKVLEQKFHSQKYENNYIVSCLQKDLIDYQAYVKDQISQKEPVIQEILNELQLVVNEINPSYKVNLYGSYCTGLCLPWSDIDTVLTCESDIKDEYFLSRLYYKLVNKPWVKDKKFIENTTIPIIKLVSNDKFNFHIDISEESEKHFGLKTVELVKSYLKAYNVLEPIILALKTLLNNGNLNNPYTGGLSSYGLILMVVSFIQSEIDNDKFNEKSPNILGETFLNVLGHYGIFFFFYNYVIITYPVDENSDISDRDSSFSFAQNSHELIIVDPLNKQNNVAKSTFQFMNIKMAFLIAFIVAKEDCECGCHHGYMENHLEKTEHCILKRIFNSIKRFKDTNKNSY